jgi:hypothetical protein
MIYHFSTDAAYYAGDPTLAEPLDIYWDNESGLPLGLIWDHSHRYGLHPSLGRITEEPGSYFALEVLMTDFDHPVAEFRLRGVLSVDFGDLPLAQLAALHIGSYAAWLAATGTLSVVGSVPVDALPPKF